MNERIFIPVITLSELAVAEHFQEESSFEQENIERCPECGSSLFRIYHEPVPEGTYEQNICAVCNHRVGGWLNDFKRDSVVYLKPSPKMVICNRRNDCGGTKSHRECRKHHGIPHIHKDNCDYKCPYNATCIEV